MLENYNSFVVCSTSSWTARIEFSFTISYTVVHTYKLVSSTQFFYMYSTIYLCMYEMVFVWKNWRMIQRPTYKFIHRCIICHSSIIYHVSTWRENFLVFAHIPDLKDLQSEEPPTPPLLTHWQGEKGFWWWSELNWSAREPKDLSVGKIRPSGLLTFCVLVLKLVFIVYKCVAFHCS